MILFHHQYKWWAGWWWSTLVFVSVFLIGSSNEEETKMKAIDPEAEERLRERWTAFVAEVNKELDFDLNASSPIHVSVVENRDLYLTCAFTKPLRRHRISFLSLKDFGLLYIGQARHTPDKRFSLASTPDGHAWTLRLKRVTFKDQGLYECQVNTSPESISLILNVTVVSGRTRILPPDPLIYVNAGGQISLHCVIETGPVEPQFILWYKEGKLVEYSSVRASVTVKSDDSDKGVFQSHLIIDNVTLSDAGLYKCDSDLTGEESVQVHVVEQDFKSLYLGSHDKALITSGAAATSSSSSSASKSSKRDSISSGSKSGGANDNAGMGLSHTSKGIAVSATSFWCLLLATLPPKLFLFLLWRL